MREFRFRRPEFQEKLKRARGYQRKTAGVFGSRFARFGILVVLLLAAYFLMVSGFFLVGDAVVTSSSITSEQVNDVLAAMGRTRAYLIPQNHILILTRQSLLAAFQKELPQVRAVTSLRRIFPNRIEIAVEERQPSYIWQTGQNYYLLDQDGVVFQEVKNYQPSAFSEILITDRTTQAVRVGDQLEAAKVLEFIQHVKEIWPRLVPQADFVSFSIPSTKSPDIFARTNIGFEVDFDLERSAQVQLENLNLLLSREIKPETYTGLSYVDLRLPNIGYYCYQDAPCAK